MNAVFNYEKNSFYLFNVFLSFWKPYKEFNDVRLENTSWLRFLSWFPFKYLLRRNEKKGQIKFHDGLCTLCFCFPTKMLHLKAPFIPLKCSVFLQKVSKMFGNAHYTEEFYQ